MWRRFSLSTYDPATDNSPATANSSKKAPPPPPPTTPTTEIPKSASSLSNAQTPAAAKKDMVGGVKEHDLGVDKPAGFGKRRRSSLLERWTRESTKEGTLLSPSSFADLF